MNILDLHKHFIASKGVSTDTREKLQDRMFFALKGDNFDGNKFAQKALAKGAKLAVVDDKSLVGNSQVVVVENTLSALQDLARFHRRYLKLPLIAITGSNGKTTTKELVAGVLAEKYKVKQTLGNLNNHIGVPLTLLQMNLSTQIGVVEMGANHQKEIAHLCVIAEPNYGYITNFGKAHLEGFGGFEGVIKGKSELYDFLRESGKKIFVNGDDELALKQSSGGSRIIFGKGDAADCQVSLESVDPLVRIRYREQSIKSQLLGAYNADNIAAAICIGEYFEVSPIAIKRAIEQYKPDNNRSQVIQQGTNRFILDAYNANPTSMKLAIGSFKSYTAEYRVAILGDMFEIGDRALAEHQKIVDLLEAESAIDVAFVCGETFAQTTVGNVRQFSTFQELKDTIATENFQNSFILIKGSRGMAMERVLKVF